MSIRSTALRWLAQHYRVRDADIFTSRHYPASESWTARDAWWVQIPVHRIEALGTGDVHLVCEVSPNAGAFHYLRVPAAFLRDHMTGLDRPGDGGFVSLFLSADDSSRFRDERGSAGVEFGAFVQSPPTLRRAT